jgi:collagenase-like PrtC family protease
LNSATPGSVKPHAVPFSASLQLGCMAASPLAVRSAIDHGVDWVRIPYRLVEHPPRRQCDNRLENVIRYVHGKGCRLALDLSTLPDSVAWACQTGVIAWASNIGIDALVLSDAALSLYCAVKHPDLPLHVVAPDTLTAKSALQIKHQLGASRILVPRTISIARLEEIAGTGIELEVQGLGRIGGASADDACNDSYYSPVELAAAALRQLPQLLRLRVRTIHVEARNGTPSEVAKVAQIWRAAIDGCAQDASHFK